MFPTRWTVSDEGGRVTSPRWLAALIGVLVVQLLFAVALLVVELDSGEHGALFSLAELVRVTLGFAVVLGCSSWFLASRRELDRRAQVLDVAAATSHDWQWESDTDDVLTYSNDAVIDLLGYSPEDLVGCSSFDLLYDEAARQKAFPLRDATNQAHAGWRDRELTWRHRDGSPVRLEGSAAPIRDRRGHVLGYRGARRLVTEDTQPREVVRAARARVSAALRTTPVDVALQPIVSLVTGRLTGVEALARFHDRRGPDAWFHDAQTAGRTRDLDELTFLTALSALPALPADVYLSVNAGPELLMDAVFRTRVADLGLPLERLVIEITEHARVADYDQLNAALEPLRAHGVRFAIDDTGAGYASLSHVLRLNPDIVKLDRDLIANLEHDRARRSLVTALVLLALDVGATVTGEGVETSSQLETLAALGVDQVQGYLLARPTTDSAVWNTWWNANLLRQVTQSHLSAQG